jgi:hypothetical protein
MKKQFYLLILLLSGCTMMAQKTLVTVNGEKVVSDKSMVGLGNVDNTSDVNKPISTATQTALNAKVNNSQLNADVDARIAVQKGVANGIAPLEADGKISSAYLSVATINNTFIVATEAAMLALSAVKGDVAIRTDLSKSYILQVAPSSILSNWVELLTPSGGVSSFNGRTGPVTPSSTDYTTAIVAETINKNYQTDNQKLFNDATSSIQTQLNTKLVAANIIAGSGITVTPAGNNVTIASPSGYSNVESFTYTNGWVPNGYSSVGRDGNICYLNINAYNASLAPVAGNIFGSVPSWATPAFDRFVIVIFSNGTTNGLRIGTDSYVYWMQTNGVSGVSFQFTAMYNLNN